MSKLVEHVACTKCTSSDGMALYEQEDGRIDGYCFVCKGYDPDPLNGEKEKSILEYPTKTKNNQKSDINMDFIKQYPINPIRERGISKEVAQLFEVRTEYDQRNGEPRAYYWPIYREGQQIGWKRRDAQTKDFTSIGDGKKPDFFGQHLFGTSGKMVVLTEGEFDAMAAYQMFNKIGKKYRVWSLPNGASLRTVKDHLEVLESFESVILCLDQDEPGQECAKEIAELLSPGKCKVMGFSEKDANDMLRQGKTTEFISAFRNARDTRPDGIISAEEVLEEAIKPVSYGLSWPWERLTEVTYGIRRKELYGFGGGTGAGKTEGFKEVINHILVKHDLPVGVIFLEENPAMTLKILAGKMENKMFHVPEGDWTPDELRGAVEKIKDKVYLYDHFGQKDWDQIKPKIRYMVAALGIKDIFLDHLTALVADENDVNKSLERVMSDMAALTQELDFTLYFVSHLSTPLGTPHEEGGRVKVAQFRGSRTIGYWSHFLFGYERDQQAEDEDERNTVTLRVLKDRYTGMATGTTIPLRYNRDTGRFLEDGQMMEF